MTRFMANPPHPAPPHPPISSAPFHTPSPSSGIPFLPTPPPPLPLLQATTNSLSLPPLLQPIFHLLSHASRVLSALSPAAPALTLPLLPRVNLILPRNLQLAALLFAIHTN